MKFVRASMKGWKDAVAKLGATHAWGFDLEAACSGFLFALTVGGAHIPLLLIAIMTMILITSSGTMAGMRHRWPRSWASRPPAVAQAMVSSAGSTWFMSRVHGRGGP